MLEPVDLAVVLTLRKGLVMSALASLDGFDAGVFVVVGCVLIALVAMVVLWFWTDRTQHEE